MYTLLGPSCEWGCLLVVGATRWPLTELAEDGLEHRQERRHTSGANRPVPQRLELLPSRCVRHMPHGARERLVRPPRPQNGAPAVEVAIRLAVSALECRCGHAGRPEDRV